MKECSIEDCHKPSRKRGWCSPHYAEWYRQAKPGEVHKRWKPERPARDGFHWCCICHEELPLSAFGQHGKLRDGVRGVRPHCNECRSVTRLGDLYGITRDQYMDLWVKQDGLCAACHQPETALTKDGTRVRNLSVDHDHRCCPGKKSCGKCIRALLCSKCNVALGWINEDKNVLLNLVQYIEEVCGSDRSSLQDNGERYTRQ